MSKLSPESIEKILMKKIVENKREAISYLLGELSEAERELMEERIFLDEDFSLFLESVEIDLIDEYIRGELEIGEKKRFENAYLTTKDRRERVRATQVLHTKLFDEKKIVVAAESKAPFWLALTGFFRMPNLAWAGGLATVLLVLLGSFWLLNRPPIDHEIVVVDNKPTVTPTQIPTPQNISPDEDKPSNTNESLDDNKNAANPNTNPPQNNQPNNSDIKPPKPATNKSTQNPQPQPVPRPPRVFAFSLLPPLRSSERPVLKIPSAAQTVRLQLFDNFGEKYVKYLVELNDGSGNSLWGQEVAASKKRPQKSVTINIPSGKFKAGSYELAVSGITAEGNVEEINFYNFVVQKRGKE